MNYFNFIQENVVELRDFEYARLKESMHRIDTDQAFDMEQTTESNLQLDYSKVRNILLRAENFRRLYTYRDTQEFLAIRSEQYVRVNNQLIQDLSAFLDQ